MAITLTAGASGNERGYSDGSLGPAYGTLVPATLAGMTVKGLFTDTTALPNTIQLLVAAGNLATLTGKDLIIDGVTYTQASITDFGATGVYATYTATGFGFVTSTVYSVDMVAPPAYAGPTFVGVSTANGNTASFNITYSSSGRANNDMLLLGIETANQAASAPSGFVQVPGAANPQSRGTAAAAGGLRGTVFNKTSDGTETTIAIADSGDHQYAVGLVVRPSGGATALAVDVIDGATAPTASTSGSFPGVTTTVDDCLIVTFVFTDRDIAAASWSGQAGGAANLTERFDNGTAAGQGGGIAIYTAEKQAAGATGTITATQAASAFYSSITLAIRNASAGTVYNDNLTETGTAGHSQTTTATFPNARSESAASAVTQSAAQVMPSAITEAATASDAETAGSTYDGARTESVGASDLFAATMSFANALSETGAAGESSATSATFGASAAEAVTSADSSGSSATWPAARAETVAANDNASSETVFASSRSESASAEDIASAENTIASTLSEQAVATVAEAAATILPANLAETAIADDDAVGNVVGGSTTYDEVLSEEGSASVSAAASLVTSANRVETLLAAADQSVVGVFLAARTETTLAAEAAGTAMTLPASLAEAASSTAAQIVAGVFALPLAETIAANDDEVVSISADETLFEPVSVGDAYEVDGGERIPAPPSRHVYGTHIDRDLSGTTIARHVAGQPIPRHVTGTPTDRQLTAVTVRRVAT